MWGMIGNLDGMDAGRKKRVFLVASWGRAAIDATAVLLSPSESQGHVTNI